MPVIYGSYLVGIAGRQKPDVWLRSRVIVVWPERLHQKQYLHDLKGPAAFLQGQDAP
jgi:hypothetical protein